MYNKIKYLILIMILTSMISANLYACNLMGAIALNGTTLKETANRNVFNVVSNKFKTQSPANPNGWGLSYFTSASGFDTGQGKIFTSADKYNVNDYMLSNRYASSCYANGDGVQPTQYDTAIQEIFAQANYPEVIVGHLRNGTSGNTSPNYPNPHPFVYENGTHSFTFVHNGSIYGGGNNPVTNECLDMKNAVLNYEATNNDDNLFALANTNLDSSIYFAYLMMHIKLNDWDILRGLSQALAGKNCNNSTGYNFILSDGCDLYAYRYSNSTTSRTLSYVYFNNVATTQGTQRVINSAYVMTSGLNEQLNITGSGLTITQFNSYRDDLDNDELAYIPKKGKVVLIKNFSKPNEKLLVKNTNPNPGRGVWNWESFPIMRGNSDDAIRTFAQNIPDGAYTYSNDGFDYATYAINVEQKRADKLITGWQYQNQAFLVAPKAGYKIYSSAAETVKIKGTLCDNTGIGTMEVGPIYWVGYWLMNSQSLQDALGENFSKVRRVWAENWSYDTFENEAKTDPISVNLSNPNRPMEFGKMYAIQLSQFTTPIANFTWANSRKPASGNFNMSASYFAYNQTPNYEAIDIMSVTKNNMPYKEIGVFAGEKCIGATAIDQFPVQILAYTDGYEGQVLTFRALNENGAVSEINPVVNTYNRKSGEYEESVLIAGEIDYQVLKIEEIQNPDAMEIPAMVTDHRCYPNPFNPSTNISFSISNKTQVQVNIYNVKGQKVKALFNGELNQGKHFLRWDGQNDNGSTVSSGIYFYRIEAGKSRINQKMMLMK